MIISILFKKFLSMMLAFEHKKFKWVITYIKSLETKKTKNNDNKDNERKDIENSSINNSKYTFDSSDVKEIMTGVGGEGSAYPDSDKYIVEDLKKTIKKEETGVDEENDARNDSEQSSKDTNRWSISYINSWLIWTWKKNKIFT